MKFSQIYQLKTLPYLPLAIVILGFLMGLIQSGGCGWIICIAIALFLYWTVDIFATYHVEHAQIQLEKERKRSY